MVKLGPQIKRLIRDIIVAVCTAVITFLTTSCTGNLVVGKSNSTTQRIKTEMDSSYVSTSASLQR